MAMGKRGKKARDGLSRDDFYPLDKAVDLIKKGATAKFDETIEVAMNLGIDPKQGDQNVRGVVRLPHGTGKTLRVAVFAKRSEEHTSELQSPYVISYAVFCLK